MGETLTSPETNYKGSLKLKGRTSFSPGARKKEKFISRPKKEEGRGIQLSSEREKISLPIPHLPAVQVSANASMRPSGTGGKRGPPRVKGEAPI